MTNTILALSLGIVFGLLLNKAGLTKYNKIVNVFRFTDLAVLKFMMTALVVAMTGLFSSARPRPGDLPERPRDLYRRQCRWRAGFRRRHGASRLLTGHMRRRWRRRKIGLHRSWVFGFPDRCSHLRPDLSVRLPEDLGFCQLRADSHARFMEHQLVPADYPVCADQPAALLPDRPRGHVPQEFVGRLSF